MRSFTNKLLTILEGYEEVYIDEIQESPGDWDPKLDFARWLREKDHASGEVIMQFAELHMAFSNLRIAGFAEFATSVARVYDAMYRLSEAVYGPVAGTDEEKHLFYAGLAEERENLLNKIRHLDDWMEHQSEGSDAVWTDKPPEKPEYMRGDVDYATKAYYHAWNRNPESLASGMPPKRMLSALSHVLTTGYLDAVRAI